MAIFHQSDADDEAFAVTQAEIAKKLAELQAPPSARLTCEDCDEALTHQRKLLVPSATRCVSCQELYEAHMKGKR